MNDKDSNTNLYSSTFVDYKFYPPQLFSSSIKRRQLLSEFMHQKTYSAVIIQGPAGHGKSTLMRQIKQQCEEQNFSTGWLSFENGDNDISHFNRLLRMLFHKVVESKLTNDVIDSFNPNENGSSAIESILQILNIIKGNAAIFIDEFHCINESVNVEFLETIIERSPPNIFFYIGTRSIPELVKGKLFISGQIRWVRPEELCFNLDEFKEFIKIVGLNIDESDAEKFLEQTGGWPAVLQLLHLALKGGQVNKTTLLAWVKGSIAPLAQYLADNVMLNQSDTRKEFLFKISILNKLSAPLCEFITGESKSGLILEELVSQGMFIQPTDFERKWFKFHSLFLYYLSQVLEEKFPTEINSLHRRASLWYRENDYFEDAIEHSLSAGDYHIAADILSDWIPELVGSARLNTIDSLCEKIPETSFFNRPFLCWGRIWAKYFLSQTEEASKCLQVFSSMTPKKPTTKQLRQSIAILNCIDLLFNNQISKLSLALSQLDFEVNNNETYIFFETGVLCNLRAISNLQHLNFSESKELAFKGEVMSMKGNAAFSSAYSSSLYALTLIQEGKAFLAIDKLKARLNSPELKIQGSLATSSLSAIYGLALYETGNFLEAESHLSDTIALIVKSLPLDWIILASLALFRSRTFIENSTINSLTVLDEVQMNAQHASHERLSEILEIEKFRVNVANDINYISHKSCSIVFKEKIKEQAKFHLADGTHDKLIHTARYYIATGKIDEAIELLQASLENSLQTKWIRRELKVRTLLSLAYNKANDKKNADEMMMSAISLSQSTGLISNFIEEGGYCLNIISNIDKNTNNRNSLDFIYDTLDIGQNSKDDKPNTEIQKNLIEALTKRELDILKLVANGSTNAEISDLLFISYNTVKFHMKNLYGKLDAKNRIVLISIANKNNLI